MPPKKTTMGGPIYEEMVELGKYEDDVPEIDWKLMAYYNGFKETQKRYKEFKSKYYVYMTEN